MIVYQVIRTGWEDTELLSTFSTNDKALSFIRTCLDYEKTECPIEDDDARHAYDINHPAGDFNSCARNYSIIELTVL